MASTDNGKHEKEIEESIDTRTKSQGQIPLDDSTSRKMLLSGEMLGGKSDNMFSYITKRIRLLKFGSASDKFKQIAEQRDEISQSVASSAHGLTTRLNGVFSRKVDWVSIKKMGKEWIRNPMNMALLAWIVCVAVSGAILFLVMTGMLNKAIPKKSQRDVWFEVNNQILNALFTLMCLYQHPKRLYHFVLLCRWSPKDIARLRNNYCKNGTYKPHEWTHMMVVVVLLNLNCFAQYALCGLNLGYRRSNRPAIGVGICISVAIGAPAFAGVYSMMSPLGKDFDSERDEEAQIPITAYNFCCGRPAVSDCALWLCCCFCTLAQEVRTGNAYDVVGDKFSLIGLWKC